MKAIYLIFTCILMCVITTISNAQSYTEVDTREDWIIEYQCDNGDTHAIVGTVERHIMRHFNVETGRREVFNFTAHGEFESTSGEVFKLNQKFSNNKKSKTVTMHYTFIGNQGTHILYMKKSRWIDGTGWVLLQETTKCV